MNVFQRLRAAWLGADVPINQGADPSQIAAFESKHCVELPLAFKNYLMIVNGMSDGATDDQLISFLSLNAIDREMSQRETPPHPRDLIFAEYLIYSHVYVIRTSPLREHACIFAADGSHERQLAVRLLNSSKATLSVPKRWEPLR